MKFVFHTSLHFLLYHMQKTGRFLCDRFVNFATSQRHFSGQIIDPMLFFNTLITKMTPPGGEIKKIFNILQ